MTPFCDQIGVARWQRSLWQSAGILGRSAANMVGLTCKNGLGMVGGSSMGVGEGFAGGFAEGFVRGGLETGTLSGAWETGLNDGLMGAAMGGAFGAAFNKLCFAAGTEVIVGMEYEDESGELRQVTAGRMTRMGLGERTALMPRVTRYVTSPIEELKAGDWVLTRDEADASGELVLRQIEETFANTAYCLHVVTVRSSTGVTQTIKTTAEHPVYVLGKGWVAADAMESGDKIQEPDGSVSEIVGFRKESHFEGITVYNFRVAESHTYFVREGGSTAEPVSVHNNYRETARQAEGLTNKQLARMKVGHMVPQSSTWSRFSSSINRRLQEMTDILEDVGMTVHDSENLFITRSPNHLGTHTPQFFRALHKVMIKAAGSAEAVEDALLDMRERVLFGEFM